MEEDLEVAETIEIEEIWRHRDTNPDTGESDEVLNSQSQSSSDRCETGTSQSGSVSDPSHDEVHTGPEPEEAKSPGGGDVELPDELPLPSLISSPEVSSTCSPGSSAPSSTKTSPRMRNKPKSKPRSPRKKKNENCNVEWSKLPYGIILEILGYLEEKDRASLGRSCKNFYAVFHSPVLWRRKYVLFSGVRSPETASKSCVFINKFGKYIRTLEIECGHPTLHSARPISLAVEMFLNYLSRIRGTKIISFKIDYMDFYHGWRFFELSRARLIGALCKFIRKQRHLQFLDISGAQIDTRDGSRVLKALAACYARNSLQSLYMKDFFELRFNSTNNISFTTTLKKFTALKEIYINFMYLNPTVLEILGRRLGETLELIRLVVDSSESQSRSVTAHDWRMLREKCPKMKVVFHFLGLLSYNEYTSALCRGIPLIECDILSWEGFPNDLEPDSERMSDVLRHLANNFYKDLVRFRLSIDHCSPGDRLDQPMISLLQQSTKLQEFTINAALSLPTVETICKIAAARKPKLLEHLELRVRGLTPEDNSRLIQITQTYLNEIRSRELAVVNESF